VRFSLSSSILESQSSILRLCRLTFSHRTRGSWSGQLGCRDLETLLHFPSSCIPTRLINQSIINSRALDSLDSIGRATASFGLCKVAREAASGASSTEALLVMASAKSPRSERDDPVARASRFSPMSTMQLTSATRAHAADRYPDNPLSRSAIYNVQAARQKTLDGPRRVIERSDAVVNYARDRRG